MPLLALVVRTVPRITEIAVPVRFVVVVPTVAGIAAVASPRGDMVIVAAPRRERRGTETRRYRDAPQAD
jgi:hypothetical protein